MLTSPEPRAKLAGSDFLAPVPRPALLPRPETQVPTLISEIWTECWQRATWNREALTRLAAVLPLATLCSWLGIVLSRQSDGVATIWISNGVIFGLLITQPRQRWLAYFLVGLIADTAADLLYGDPFHLAFGVSLANSFEVVTSALLLTAWFGSPLDLSRRKTLVGFLLISVLGATALTSALGASWTLFFVPGPSWWQMFRTWYLGDMLGMAVIAPLIIMTQRHAFFSMFERRQIGHTLLVLAASVVITALIFSQSKDPLIFFMFPAFLLVAFRLGLPGTVVNILIVTLMTIGFTVKGYGPLMLVAGPHMMLHRIVIAQIFAAVAIFTMFPVAALLEEKDRLQKSLATSEARFRSLAHADELTGMPNRRAFKLRLEAAWESALASTKPLALILLDADQFKQYNDVAGHLGGDACLRAIAQAVIEIVRLTNGSAARIGGEEFAVILPDTSLPRAMEIAEQIRLATEDLAVPHPSSPHGVQTVSLGVAITVPQSDENPISLMRLADQALYSAKLNGRNCVASN